jgi:hypothetical protein
MKSFGIGLLILVGLLGLGWVLTANDLALQKVFAPAREQVRRDTFEQSKAYRDGVIQELRSMQFEYLRADEKHKAGLANVIRHKLAGFPEDAIPSDLQQFIKELP